MSEADGKNSIMRQVVVALIVAGAGGIVGLGFTYHQTIYNYVFPKQPVTRTVLSRTEVLTAMAKDLERTEADRRPGRCYLTLVHLHNDPTITEEELERTRTALRETLTWLAPAGQVPALEPVDQYKAILALNLSEIGWDPKTQWRALLEQYPYDLDRTGVKDAKLAAAASSVRKLAPVTPHVRGDWFVAAVIRPPLGGKDGTLKVPVREVPTAVRAFGQTYPEQTLDLNRAAREIGAKPEAVKTKIQKEKRLGEKFGLAPLAGGKTITRAAWESRRFTTSPYQELAQELNLGIPEAR